MMKLEFPHRLPLDDAKARISALLDYWGRKYGLKSTWTGDKATFTGKVMGIAFDGHFIVTASGLGGEATDPGFLFRGKATDYLKRKFGHYLDPQKTLQQVQGEV
jgi:hypothetical protein